MKFRHLLTSVSIHLFLLAGIVFVYQQTKFEKIVERYVPVYSSAMIQPVENKILPSKKEATPVKRIAQRTIASDANKQERDNLPLLKLLHEAIAAQQQYPESALQLNQTGTVKVGFLLQPDGMVRNAIVLASSGNENLDQAALSAVNATTPIANVNRYLKQKKSIEVDVVFR